MVALLNKLVFRLYVISLMAFTVWYGHFMYPLIFGFEGKEEAAESIREIVKTESEEETMFSRLIAEQTKTSQTDLGLPGNRRVLHRGSLPPYRIYPST